MTQTPNLLQVHLQMKLQEKATLEFHTCDAPLLCWKVRGNSDSLKRTVAQHALITNERECGACAGTQTRKDALASRQRLRAPPLPRGAYADGS